MCVCAETYAYVFHIRLHFRPTHTHTHTHTGQGAILIEERRFFLRPKAIGFILNFININAGMGSFSNNIIYMLLRPDAALKYINNCNVWVNLLSMVHL